MPAERQEFSAAPVREEAAESDAHEAARQRVGQEPSQELLAGYSHQSLLALVGMVFPAERDLAVGKVDDPMIGDGNAMRVASQILEDMLGPSEGTLGVHHPVLTEQRTEKRMESFLLAEPIEASGKQQLAVTESLLEPSYELAAKDTTQPFAGRKNGYRGCTQRW